ncbi:FAD-dependent monooxygenase [bacterium]|nr:FAD-dependent monooxygenase [bacterium]
MSDKIILIGAGLAGSLLSVYLAKKGYQVELFERRPDMRKTNIGAGRSINLALSTRGIHALKEVGLYEEIMKIAIPMKGRMIHNRNGDMQFQPYGKNDSEVINAVSRGDLNMRLMDLAEKNKNVTIHFNERCTGMNFSTGEVHLTNEVSSESHIEKGRTVIGTDGSASAIRMDMLKIGRFSFSQSYLEHGYKELTIPAGDNGDFLLEKNALHIWPRKTYMLIALPNIDGSFTCTLFYPMEGENSFEALKTESQLLAFFQKEFPDALALMPTLREDYFTNPVGTLITVKCSPWYVEDKVVLLGDAAHAMVPFYGQGMNCAFEDCTYLNGCIESFGPNWETVFKEYEKLRKVNANAIADLAVENFYEMRDKVSDPLFVLKKKIEHVLEEKFPGIFIPKYTMVSFMRVPYATAMQRGLVQDFILNELTIGIERMDEVDLIKAEQLIRDNLTPM